MAKVTNRNFIKVDRRIFNPEYKLSVYAIALYCCLCELEMKYCGSKAYFTRSEQDLSDDSKMSIPTLRKARKELVEAGFLQIELNRYVDKKGKKSTFKITKFELTEPEENENAKDNKCKHEGKP